MFAWRTAGQKAAREFQNKSIFPFHNETEIKDFQVCIVELNPNSELLIIYNKLCCLKSKKGQA